jgi:phage replication-related protein YjqB (UPF0714/DUF867 family)
MDCYSDYNELSRNEREGVDYRIRRRNGTTGFCIMAPHGGEIEPGTSEVADAIAGDEHAFYSFEGLKPTGNEIFHIPSVAFDEPLALLLAKMSQRVITVHGCADEGPSVFIGGLDTTLIDKIKDSLQRRGFSVSRHPNPNLHGVHSDNLCNISASGKGVQLELTKALRCEMLTGLTPGGRKVVTSLFSRFVEAVREALDSGRSHGGRRTRESFINSGLF